LFIDNLAESKNVSVEEDASAEKKGIKSDMYKSLSKKKKRKRERRGR
jgi:hypothetical protein